MGAPSQLHEARRYVLRDVAALAGFYIDVPLTADEYPDVVRLHHRRPALFVGDAKATELPSCEATRRRLTRYFRTARSWLAVGFDVTIAIGHSNADGEEWARMLENAARDARCPIGPAASSELDGTTVVTWVDARSHQHSTM